MIGERIRDKFAASPGARHVDGRQGAARLRRARPQARRSTRPKRRGCGACSSVFAETGSGAETVRQLRAEGRHRQDRPPAREGRSLQAAQQPHLPRRGGAQGHAPIPASTRRSSPHALWDRVHAILQESPRARASRNRSQTPALLRGLIFGADGRAMSPTHTRRRGRLYRYYVSQTRAESARGGSGDRAPGVRRPRSRAPSSTSCGRCCASRRSSSAPGARRGKRRPT